MTDPLRIAVSGAGRVFERLYLPALRSIHGVELRGVADPASDRRATAGPAVAGFESLPALLDVCAVDAVIVLSPPGQHSADALVALQRDLPVLVEKPLCRSSSEVEELALAGGGRLLTPAFSRRYWPAYHRIKAAGPARDLRIAIAVGAQAWDAHSGPADIAEDLFPHVADLARWLMDEEMEEVAARRNERGIAVTLAMSGGARAVARLDVRDAYLEAARADGRSWHVGPPRTAESLARRIVRRPDPPVRAVADMVAAWAESIVVGDLRELPSFNDGAASVRAMEQLRAALNQQPV